MVDYFEITISFLAGLVIASISAILANHFNKKQAKEEPILPYYFELHGIISRILDAGKGVGDLSQKYRYAFDVEVNEKMKAEAKKNVLAQSKILDPGSPTISESSITWMLFGHSCSQMMEVIKECHNFERLYTEMDKKGFISTIGLRDKNLSGNLAWFHESAKYVSRESSILMKDYESIKTSDFTNPMFQTTVLPVLFNLSIGNLLSFGDTLEKRLKKYI